MKELNDAGITTPLDKDGDLMPAVVMGLSGLNFPDSRGLYSMIGEIGGSAEWAVGVLPLVWRGGQAVGMLTSQSSLTRKDLDAEGLWRERFHYTEEEYMLIQDARFERKPYFTIFDILEDPFAGGVSAFGSITDNYYLPFMTGVTADQDKKTINANVISVNSIGVVECWMFKFKCKTGVDSTIKLMSSPKEKLENLAGKDLETAVDKILNDEHLTRRYRIFFNNEYYPALIPVRDKMIVLHKALDGLIKRGALSDHDRTIVTTTEKLAGDWFINSD